MQSLVFYISFSISIYCFFLPLPISMFASITTLVKRYIPMYYWNCIACISEMLRACLALPWALSCCVGSAMPSGGHYCYLSRWRYGNTGDITDLEGNDYAGVYIIAATTSNAWKPNTTGDSYIFLYSVFLSHYRRTPWWMIATAPDISDVRYAWVVVAGWPLTHLLHHVLDSGGE